MSWSHLILLLMLSATVMGCKSGPGAKSGCPENNEVQGVPLGAGALYSARNVPGAVEIHARGRNQTAGWINLLAVSPLRVYPPLFELHQKPPEGMAAQVITEFEVCLKHRTDQPFERITIRDADGAHAIDVTPIGR